MLLLWLCVVGWGGVVATSPSAFHYRHLTPAAESRGCGAAICSIYVYMICGCCGYVWWVGAVLSRLLLLLFITATSPAAESRGGGAASSSIYVYMICCCCGCVWWVGAVLSRLHLLLFITTTDHLTTTSRRSSLWWVLLAIVALALYI